MTESVRTQEKTTNQGTLPKYDRVTVSELRRNLREYVGSIQRRVVTRDNRPTAVLIHYKDFQQMEALLDWALRDPQSLTRVMEEHRRVQSEGVSGVEIDDLAEQMASSSR